jgi:hypothetical protein
VTSAGGADIFVTKLDAAGDLLWKKTTGDGTDQQLYAMAVDAAGDIVVAGDFTGTIDFGAGALTSAGAADVYVAKLDPSGNALWSKRAGDALPQNAHALATDPPDTCS